MSQHSLVIADGTGAEVLTALTEAFDTVATLNGGSTEPAETYPFMWWADTTTGLLKLRNAANTDWVEVGTLSDANLGLITTDAIGDTVQAHDDDLDALSASGAGAQLASYGVNGVGFKNRIINGDMRIDQRNAGASGTATNFAYTLDRWKTATSSASKYTVQQNAGSVTPPAGFTNYLGITSSAATTVASTDYYFLMQLIEGFNVADLGWGTANAQPVTLSFRVRSSLTGTFGGSLENNAGNRSYPFSYTISSANTWTTISVTVPGDTTGTWLTNNGNGMYVHFSLGVGSTRQGTANTWGAGDYQSVAGETQVVGTNGATFYITGVQLEKGSTATSFDYRPYGTELALCMRYYQKLDVSGFLGVANSTTKLQAAAFFPVIMRAAPNTTTSGTVNQITAYGIVDLSGTWSWNNGTSATQYGVVGYWSGSGMTTGQCYGLNPAGTAIYYIGESEL